MWRDGDTNSRTIVDSLKLQREATNRSRSTTTGSPEYEKRLHVTSLEQLFVTSFVLL